MKGARGLLVFVTCVLFGGLARAQDPATSTDAVAPTEEEVPAPEEAEVERTAEPAIGALDSEGRERFVAELLSAHPRWVSRVTWRDGDDADESKREGPFLLALADHGEEGVVPRQRPALFFAGGGRGLHGDAVSLTLAARLVEEAAAGGDVARLLGASTIYLGVAFPPELDVDFPAGWRPPRMGGRGSSAPLARPDSRALARFLGARPEIVSVARLRRAGMGPGQAWRGSFAPAPDRQAAASFLEVTKASAVEVSLWPAAGQGGGGLLDWAYQAHGLFVWALHEPALEAGDELDAWVELAGKRLVAAVEALPRVRFGAPDVRSIGTDLWCVEVPVINEGRLPTSSLLAERNGLWRRLHLRPQGVRLVAFAFARGPRTNGLTFESGTLMDMSSEPSSPDPPDPLAGPEAPAREAVLPGRLEARGTIFVRLILAPLEGGAEKGESPTGVNETASGIDEVAAPEVVDTSEAASTSVADDSTPQAARTIELVTPEGVLDSLRLDALR